MRKVLILILLIAYLSIHPVCGKVSYASVQNYAKANNNDTGIYQYFSKILEYSDKCIKSVADEKPNVNLSTNLNKILKITWKECLLYSSRGLKSNVSLVIKPFINLTRAVKELSIGQSEFLNQSNLTLVMQGFTKMRVAIQTINYSINEINNTTLWNGTSQVHFKTSPLKKDLKRVVYLLKMYNTTVYKLAAKNRGFFISVSNTHPFLYEKVFVYIYTQNTKPIYVVVNPVNGPIKRISISSNSVVLRFNKTGIYRVHAEGLRNGNVIRSNTVDICVTKIPTTIILSANTSAVIYKKVKVLGFLSDYYGNPINSSVYVYVGNYSTILQSRNGYFSFNVTRKLSGYVNITTIYKGSNIYKSTSDKLSIYFSRIPVSIHITPNRTRVAVNESVRFIGSLKGIKKAKIKIFVNSSCVSTINVSKNFSFYVTFKKAGNYCVYTYFSGNSTYSPAKSNVVYITVRKKVAANMYPLLASVFILIVFLIGYYTYKTRKEKEKGKRKGKGKKKKEKKEVKAKKEVAQPEQAAKKIKKEKAISSFQQMFSALVSKYNLKRGLTPRELYEQLKDEKFSKELKKVIDIHEKLMYEEQTLSEDEFKMYYHLISEIMEEIR